MSDELDLNCVDFHFLDVCLKLQHNFHNCLHSREIAKVQFEFVILTFTCVQTFQSIDNTRQRSVDDSKIEFTNLTEIQTDLLDEWQMIRTIEFLFDWYKHRGKLSDTSEITPEFNRRCKVLSDAKFCRRALATAC